MDTSGFEETSMESTQQSECESNESELKIEDAVQLIIESKDAHIRHITVNFEKTIQELKDEVAKVKASHKEELEAVKASHRQELTTARTEYRILLDMSHTSQVETVKALKEHTSWISNVNCEKNCVHGNHQGGRGKVPYENDDNATGGKL